ncbi:MAG: hypothetical protein IKO36_05575 [Bacteroidaceae bacterium]|nr:hypothetical protein [Bacteroidaceae bacterium]
MKNPLLKSDYNKYLKFDIAFKKRAKQIAKLLKIAQTQLGFEGKCEIEHISFDSTRVGVTITDQYLNEDIGTFPLEYLFMTDEEIFEAERIENEKAAERARLEKERKEAMELKRIAEEQEYKNEMMDKRVNEILQIHPNLTYDCVKSIIEHLNNN